MISTIHPLASACFNTNFVTTIASSSRLLELVQECSHNRVVCLDLNSQAGLWARGSGFSPPSIYFNLPAQEKKNDPNGFLENLPEEN